MSTPRPQEGWTAERRDADDPDAATPAAPDSGADDGGGHPSSSPVASPQGGPGASQQLLPEGALLGVPRGSRSMSGSGLALAEAGRSLRTRSATVYSDDRADDWPDSVSLDQMSVAARLELAAQVENLPMQQRIHALFDAEGPAEEMYADRHATVARILFFTTFFMIVLSVAVFTVESLPQFYQRNLPVFFIIESICIGWFSVELVARFCTCESRVRFCKSIMNIIDFAAVFPYYLDLILLMLGTSSGSSNGLVILRVVRLTRVFRVFKLSKYDEGVQVVAMSLRRSTDALSLLIFLTCLAMVLFGSGIFFAEQQAADFDEDERKWVRKKEYGGPAVEHKLNSIPSGFWWCLVTLTTVGYGDMYPVTLGGYLVGTVAMLAGLLIVAFPIIIIGANFTEVRAEYKERQRRKRASRQANSHGGAGAASDHLECLGSQRHGQRETPNQGSPPQGTPHGAPAARMLAAQGAPGPPDPNCEPGSDAAGVSHAPAARGPAAPPHPPLPPRPPGGGVPSSPGTLQETTELAQLLLARVSQLERVLGDAVRDAVRDELARQQQPAPQSGRLPAVPPDPG
eukprot:TRINITY_DN3594_c0_g2_i1.p2 TRINITY_DN3594_c0_g2~~TRINITY_DN3594_c0_g2_i1.p2  ORF type:complete len:571 (+),score=174.52 TRINITY_DN3594_c0_g2_i1:168-1880(+)